MLLLRTRVVSAVDGGSVIATTFSDHNSDQFHPFCFFRWRCTWQTWQRRDPHDDGYSKYLRFQLMPLNPLLFRQPINRSVTEAAVDKVFLSSLVSYRAKAVYSFISANSFDLIRLSSRHVNQPATDFETFLSFLW